MMAAKDSTFVESLEKVGKDHYAELAPSNGFTQPFRLLERDLDGCVRRVLASSLS